MSNLAAAINFVLRTCASIVAIILDLAGSLITVRPASSNSNPNPKPCALIFSCDSNTNLNHSSLAMAVRDTLHLPYGSACNCASGQAPVTVGRPTHPQAQSTSTSRYLVCLVLGAALR